MLTTEGGDVSAIDPLCTSIVYLFANVGGGLGEETWRSWEVVAAAGGMLAMTLRRMVGVLAEKNLVPDTYFEYLFEMKRG